MLGTRHLLKRYRSGDKSALEELFGQHRQALVGRIGKQAWMKGLGRFASPEDLVDEVFVRVLSSKVLLQFEEKRSGDLKRFLENVLEGVAVDTFRRHGQAKRGGGRVPLRLVPNLRSGETGLDPSLLMGTETSPTANARYAEVLALCQDVLPRREWEAWRMYEVENRTSVEIGTILGCGDAAVRGLVHRARKRILTHLAENGHRQPELPQGNSTGTEPS